jgi:hypothetical protein
VALFSATAQILEDRWDEAVGNIEAVYPREVPVLPQELIVGVAPDHAALRHVGGVVENAVDAVGAAGAASAALATASSAPRLDSDLPGQGLEVDPAAAANLDNLIREAARDLRNTMTHFKGLDRAAIRGLVASLSSPAVVNLWVALGYATECGFGAAPKLDKEVRLRLVRAFASETLANVLRPGDDSALAHLHVHLVFVDDLATTVDPAYLGPDYPWSKIADMLNSLPVSDDAYDRIRIQERCFPGIGLPEDCLMRGFDWAARYSSYHCSEEVLDGRDLAEERKERCWFLALKLVGRCPLQFHQHLKQFSAGESGCDAASA